MSEKSDGERAAELRKFADLQARASKVGHRLTRTAGGFMLARWSCSKHAESLDAIELCVRRMEGKPT